MPTSERKPFAKAPLFVILSWFAPLFMFNLVLTFHAMDRNLLRDSLTHANILVATLNALRSSRFWLEAVSFTATMSIWIFALVFSFTAYRRKEKAWWLAVPPFLFGLFILTTCIWVVIFHDPRMGYHVLFSPHESYETRINF